MDLDPKNDLEIIKNFTSRTYDNDGFGAIFRLKTGQIETLKSLDIASFYIDITQKIASGTIRDLVLHHRTSTNGTGIEYAHPFTHRDHYLTHNGVVNVPGDYKTNTTNDSEKLLHHLLGTNYNTEEIQGYFSCFIFNQDETIILVDATAPMFFLDRIYCSHNLNDKMEPIALKKIVINDATKEKHIVNIKVTKSEYGASLRHLSLSSNYDYLDKDYDHASWNTNDYQYDMPMYSDNGNNADLLLSLITKKDEQTFAICGNVNELERAIERCARAKGIFLDSEELADILSYFL